MFLLLITPVLFFSITISFAQAETGVPSILSYQGRLTDSGGNLLGGAGTPYFFKFSFWDSATVGAGSQVWPVASPAPVSLTVKQGVFNVNIGDIENSYPDILNYNFGSNKKIYLQVEASANNSSFETLSPRQRITSTPFAEVAGSLTPDYLTSIFSNYFTKTESNNLYDFLGAASTTASTTIANHENIFNHNLISTALQSFTELDPLWSASSWSTTTNNSVDWNAAFGWGNHTGLYDLLGTATSTASSTLADWLASNPTSGTNTGDNATNTQYSGLATSKQDTLNGTGFVKANGTGITYDNNTYLTAETDPTFTAWDKHAGISITESQISDLKNYLTSFTELDPVWNASSWSTTTNNSANWDTAYGWGNHDSAGYAKLDGTNQPFTGTVTTSKSSDPTLRTYFTGNVGGANVSLGSMVFYAKNASGVDQEVAGIEAQSNEAWVTGTEAGTRLKFFGTEKDALTKRQLMTLAHNGTSGGVGFGSTASAIDPDRELVVDMDSGATSLVGALFKQIGTGDIKLTFAVGTAQLYSLGIDNSDGDTFKFTRNNRVDTDVVWTVNTTGDFSLPNDSQKLFFGTAKDASISYDGTNLLINPQAVGSGSTIFTGNVGIGTSTPTVALSVVGNGQFTAVGSGASANDLRITADGTLTTSASDIALKMNLEALNATTSTSSISILDKVLGLKPYKFNWKSEPNGAKDIGLIAQDVEGIFPEITFTNKVDGYKGINYSRLPVILVSAIQELSDKVVKISSYVVDGVANFTSVIAAKFTGNEADIKNIKTEKMCIGETCIDEAMLQEIILKNSIINTQTPAPANGSNTEMPTSSSPTSSATTTATSTATTTDTVASTTEAVASTTPEIIPVATSTATTTEPVITPVEIASSTEPIVSEPVATTTPEVIPEIVSTTTEPVI